MPNPNPTIGGKAVGDPDEPDLPDDTHRGSVNEASSESVASQIQKQALPPE